MHGAPRRRARLLVHHARAHGRRARGDDDRGAARAPARRRVRPDRRAPVRLLHARSDRLCLGARRGQPESELGRDPARDGRQPVPLRHVSEDRGGDLRHGKADPYREGGRGPLRGGLARRRGRRARAVARRPARDRRASGAAGDRAHARARRGALHGRSQAARDAARGRSQVPARARAREDDLARTGAGRSGRARRGRPRRRGRPHRRARPRRPGGRGRCGGHDRAGTGGGRADRRRVGRSEAAARPRRGREQGAARRRA